MDDRTENGHARARRGAAPKTRANGRSNGATRPDRPPKPEAYTLYLERQLKSLRDALTAARDGDLSVRLPAEQSEDLVGQAAWALNGLLDRGESVTREVARVSRVFARDGRGGERASIGQLSGAWSACIDGLNMMLGEVAWRTQEVASDHQRRRRGGSQPQDAAGIRGPAAAGRCLCACARRSTSWWIGCGWCPAR